MAIAARNATAPLVPSEAEARLARESVQALGEVLQGREPGALRLRVLSAAGEGPELTVPASALQFLLKALSEMARGNAVSLVSVQAELSTQQAADLLNVSRPYMVKLFENGEIPFRLVGRHRRARASDVLAYKQRIDEAREETLGRLAALSQELGLYDSESGS